MMARSRTSYYLANKQVASSTFWHGPLPLSARALTLVAPHIELVNGCGDRPNVRPRDIGDVMFGIDETVQRGSGGSPFTILILEGFTNTGGN